MIHWRDPTAVVLVLLTLSACAAGEPAEQGPAALRPAERLHQADEDVRLEAVLALVEPRPGAADAVPALARCLTDPDLLVRASAALALAAVGPDADAATPDLMKACDDVSPLVRAQAAATLARLGRPVPDRRPAEAPQPPPPLREADPEVEELARVDPRQLRRTQRDRLLWYLLCGDYAFDTTDRKLAGEVRPGQVLARLAAHDLTEVLVPALHFTSTTGGPESSLLSRACAALRQEGSAAVPALLDTLRNRDLRVRCLAAAVLSTLEPDQARAATTAIKKGTAADEPFVRRVAELALGRGEPPPKVRPFHVEGDVAALSKLVNRLGRADAEEFARVRLRLQGFDRKVVEGALEDSLLTGSPVERLRAAGLLLELQPGHGGAVKALVKGLRDEDAEAWTLAAGLLKRAGLARYHSAVSVAREGGDARLKARAAVVQASRDCIGPLVAALADEDAALRRCAAESLLAVGPDGESPGVDREAAIPVLLKMLRDRDATLRLAAAAPLAALHPWLARDESPAVLVRALRDRSPQVRCLAARALGMLGPYARRAEPALAAALEDPDDRVREEAALALFRLDAGSKESIAALAVTLDDPNPDARENAALALSCARADIRVAVPALLRTFDEESHAIREPAAEALAECNIDPSVLIPHLLPYLGRKGHDRPEPIVLLTTLGPPAARALADCLHNDDPLVRRRAAQALGFMRADARGAVSALARALEDPDEEVRSEAFAALEFQGADASPAVPTVMGLIGRTDPADDFFVAAFGLLERMGPASVPALTELLNDRRPEVRHAAAFRLRNIGAPAAPAGSHLAALLSDPDENVRLSAAQALTELDPTTGPLVVPVALAAMRDPNKKASAFGVLVYLGPHARSAVGALASALDDPDAWIRCRAVESLGAVGMETEGVLPLLTRAMGDTDKGVRETAAKAVGALGPRAGSCLPALAKLLDDADPGVRARAAEALPKVEWRCLARAITALSALAREDSVPADWAASSLADLGEPAVPALTDLLRDAGPGRRLRAVLALTHMSPSVPGVVPALVEALREEGNGAAQKAEEALSKDGEKARTAAPLLGPLLRGEAPLARLRAARVVAAVDPDKAGAAAQVLAGLLHNADRRIRLEAARALEQIGPPAALAAPDLIRLLDDFDWGTSRAAASALSACAPGEARRLGVIIPDDAPRRVRRVLFFD